MNNDPLPTALLHQRAQDTARLLQALAHPTRLLVLCRLFRQGEASAGELSSQLGIAPSALSQHLARMREEGLLEQRLPLGHHEEHAENEEDVIEADGHDVEVAGLDPTEEGGLAGGRG